MSEILILISIALCLFGGGARILWCGHKRQRDHDSGRDWEVKA